MKVHSALALLVVTGSVALFACGDPSQPSGGTGGKPAQYPTPGAFWQPADPSADPSSGGGAGGDAWHPPCGSDRDCTDGQVCSPTGHCVSPEKAEAAKSGANGGGGGLGGGSLGGGGLGGSGAGGCTSDNDCGLGEICDFGMCVPDGGGGGGLGGGGGSGLGGCASDLDCAQNEYCEVDGTCQPLPAGGGGSGGGTGCTSDLDCPGLELCEQGQCTSGDGGGGGSATPCTSDFDCALSEFCDLDGTCQPL